MALAPASSHGVDLTAANVWTANQTAPAFIASGLTGATAASRYVGATASGAPGSGTFSVGDFCIDQTAKVYVCTVAGSPGTWVAVGGSVVQTVAQYTGTNVSINNGITTALTWNSKLSGTSFLDLSTPASPTIVTAGVYAIYCNIIPPADMTAGGNYNVTFRCDTAGADSDTYFTSAAATAALPRPRVCACNTTFIPAGGILALTVGNFDGATRNYAISFTMISRLS